MLRILIVATLLFLASATSVRADAAAPPERVAVRLQLGARVGAQAFVQPAVRASLPTEAMHRSINGATEAQQAADGRNGMLALFHVRGDRPGLALPVSDSVSLGLRYQYLEREDIRFEVAETGSLDDGYSSHNVVVRARWQF
jgi:opacity protein-like surface antigen